MLLHRPSAQPNRNKRQKRRQVLGEKQTNIEREMFISATYSSSSFLDLFAEGKSPDRLEKVRFHLLCASERNKRNEKLEQGWPLRWRILGGLQAHIISSPPPPERGRFVWEEQTRHTVPCSVTGMGQQHGENSQLHSSSLKVSTNVGRAQKTAADCRSCYLMETQKRRSVYSVDSKARAFLAVLLPPASNRVRK